MIEELLRAVLEEASLLGLSWWERIGVILALALFLALGKGALGALGSIKLPPTPGPGWDPEKGTGPVSPPMDVPPGGMPVPGPGDRWGKNEP